jgi:ribosome-associated protein
MGAITQDIVDELRSAAQRRPLRQEGRPSSGWVLLDYGDVVAHIFAPAERAYYRLEDLWADAPPVLRLQ